MRKLGLIGGMSWVSTRMYYERINKLVQRRGEPMASAPLLIESLDFRQLHGLEDEADWQRAGGVLAESAKRLQDAGAEGLIICANSMHKVYRQVEDAVDIPMIHIAESVGAAMKEKGVSSAALIGTRNVMTESFYRRRLVSYGVDLLPPDLNNVDAINTIIYDELMKGKTSRDAERTLRTIIMKKAQQGAKAIVLACTELDLIVQVDANVLPIFESSRIHCQAAVDWMFSEG